MQVHTEKFWRVRKSEKNFYKKENCVRTKPEIDPDSKKLVGTTPIYDRYSDYLNAKQSRLQDIPIGEIDKRVHFSDFSPYAWKF